MAFDSASGYNNLPSGNFTPEIFSQKVLKFFRRASVAEDITNTDYAGEIENFGDTVRIIKEPTITVSNYSRGAVVNPQDLADDDIEERQSHVNFEALATSSGAYSLKRKYDGNILTAMFDGAGISSESGAATATVSGLGTLGSPLTSQTGDNLVNIMLKMARALDDQSVPEENRWFVAAPAFYETLFGAGAKFAEVQVTGDASSPLRNGLVAQGNIAGFACYKSTAMNAAGTDTVDVTGLGAGEFPILAGHMSSTATASHIAKTEVVRSTETFSDIVRGLHVFGRKVMRPEALVRSVISL